MNEKDLLRALGPVANIYSDPSILDIIVSSPEEIYVLTDEHITKDSGISLGSDNEILAIIDDVLQLGGIQLSEKHTINELRLTDGARFQAVIPPTAIQGPCFTIYKLPTRVITWENLLEWNVLSIDIHAFLQKVIQKHINLLVAGSAASGKTTIANMLIEMIPLEEFIVVVEKKQEIQISHRRSIHLEAGGLPAVSMTDLIEVGINMHPERFIVGELQGAEAMQALNAMSQGHSGLTLLRATSTEDALERLETMCLMANLGIGLSEIRRIISSALHALIFIEKLPNGRKITQISELRGIENNRFLLQPLFRYDPKTDQFDIIAQPSF